MTITDFIFVGSAALALAVATYLLISGNGRAFLNSSRHPQYWIGGSSSLVGGSVARLLSLPVSLGTSVWSSLLDLDIGAPRVT